MEELLQQAANGDIKPSLEILEIDEVPNIFERLKKNTVTGRVVVKIPQ